MENEKPNDETFESKETPESETMADAAEPVEKRSLSLGSLLDILNPLLPRTSEITPEHANFLLGSGWTVPTSEKGVKVLEPPWAHPTYGSVSLIEAWTNEAMLKSITASGCDIMGATHVHWRFAVALERWSRYYHQAVPLFEFSPYDIESLVEHMRNQDVIDKEKRKEDFHSTINYGFYNQSYEWTSKLEIGSLLRERPFKFTCGTDGHVCDELIIRVKFPKGVDIQPHDDLAEECIEYVVKNICGNMDGLIEHACDAENDYEEDPSPKAPSDEAPTTES